MPIQAAYVTWDTVSIPHSWNTHDVVDDIKGYYRGEAWYLKRFMVGEQNRGKKAYLEFKAINQEAEVYVNGSLAGSHVGGYTAFIVDITPYIQYGQENEVLVKANNRFNEDVPTLTADFTFFGGIYRDVILTFTDKVHFSMTSHGSSGVLVSTPKVSEAQADIEIKGQLLNETNSTRKIKVVSSIKDAQSQTVATATTSHNVRPGTPISFANVVKGFESPKLWSPDSIRVSYIGYETVVLPVGNRTQINITLYPDIERLEEVIVVGYGTQKRSDVTGSVASFSGDVLEKMPTVDVTQALQGVLQD